MSLTLKPAKSTDPQRPEVMDRLFARLLAFYGSKFGEAFGGVSTAALRAVWAEELAGYSLDEINRGVGYCRTQKWPPTLPEFLAACRPPVSYEAAFGEALDNMSAFERGSHSQWSHPAVYHAMRDATLFDMRRLGFKGMQARWVRLLDAQLSLGEWEPIPAPPVALLEAPSDGRPCPPHLADRIKSAFSRITAPHRRRDDIITETEHALADRTV